MVGMYIDVVADNFKMAITDDIYVDKTMLISLLNKVVCKKTGIFVFLDLVVLVSPLQLLCYVPITQKLMIVMIFLKTLK